MTEKEKIDEQTQALRVAREFKDGMVVNLGIGTPTLCSNFVPAGREVLFHSENGALGFGEMYNTGEGDPNLVNASGQTVRVQPGMSIFEHAESFAIIRGGYRYQRYGWASGFGERRPGQLAHPQEADRYHRRCHGPRQLRQERYHNHEPCGQGWLVQNSKEMQLSSHCIALCRSDRHRYRSYRGDRLWPCA
jgi:hypothetical protein